jgi:hypothetical protein
MPDQNRNLRAMKRCAFAAASCFCLAGRLWAAPGTGTTAANFLKIPVAVIPSALAESYTALIGPDSILYNPAGLGLLSYSSFSGTHNRYLDEITQEYAALAWHTRYGTIGAGLSMLSSGRFTAYDADDMIIGETSTSHKLWILSFARSWPSFGADMGKLDPMLITPGWTRIPPVLDYRPKTYRVALGASIKKVAEQLDNVNATVYTMDAGAMLVLPGHLQAGLSALNVGGEQRFIYESYPLPRVVRGGLAKDFHTVDDIMVFTVAADLVKYSDAPLYNTIGVNTDVLRMFQFRVGYRNQVDIVSSVSAGFGLNFDKFTDKGSFIHGARIDYAYLAYGQLGVTHRLGIQLIW